MFDEKARIGEGCVECRTCFRVCPKQAVVEIGRRGPRRDRLSGLPGELPHLPGTVRGLPPVHQSGRRTCCATGRSCLYDEVKPTFSYPPSPLIREPLITAIGAGTTYPDHIPAPYIVTDPREGVDVVTVVTEAPLSYSGNKNQSGHRRAHRGGGGRNPF